MKELIFDCAIKYFIHLNKKPLRGGKCFVDPRRGVEGVSNEEELIGFYLFGQGTDACEVDSTSFAARHLRCELRLLYDPAEFVIFTMCQEHNVYARNVNVKLKERRQVDE